MKLAFIVAPYRSNTIWGVRKNILEAERLGAEVACFGIFPYIPHKNTAYFDGLAPDDLWLEGNLELIRRTQFDLAVVGGGYHFSSGSLGEIQEFYMLGTPVLFREDPAFYVQIQKVKRGD